jgi:hypothetical protein
VKKVLFPNVKVHSWGGFGSQLLALAFLLDLQQKFPKRSFSLVFHTGGVTRRPVEIQSFLEHVEYTQIEDFRREEGTSSKPFLIKRHIKTFLQFTHFVEADPGTQPMPKIYPWTRSIRGHYSYRPISPNVVRGFISKLNSLATIPKDPCIFVHYRLGDLLTLHSKAYSSPEVIVSLIRESCRSLKNDEQIVVATENPEDAKKLMVDLKFLPVEFETFDPTTTLFYGLNSKTFIGTSSKLSLWIALMRNFQLTTNISYLPKNLAKNAILLNSGKNLPSLKSYDEDKWQA